MCASWPLRPRARNRKARLEIWDWCESEPTTRAWVVSSELRGSSCAASSHPRNLYAARHLLGGRSHEPRVRDQRPWWSGDVGSDAADAAGQAARAGGAAALVSAVFGARTSGRPRGQAQEEGRQEE